MKSNTFVSLDLILLLLLVPAQMLGNFEGVSFILAVSLFLYILLEFWQPLSSYSALINQSPKIRLAFFARFFLLLIIITAAVIIPSGQRIYTRLIIDAEKAENRVAYGDIHDGALQMEYALGYLRAGQNPYVARYEDTILQYYNFPGLEDLPTNPVFDYFVYLPGFLVASYPVYTLFQYYHIPYDQRWIYLLAYIATVILLPAMVNSPTLKLSLLIAVALNPLLTRPVIIGMNDVLVLLVIIIAILALRRNHFILSILAFAIACTLKQSAWFIAPFYLLLLYHSLPTSNRNREMFKLLGAGALVGALIIIPFAFWDLPNFITDVFVYPGGGVAVNYPIRGSTIGLLLLGMGFITSPTDNFPFFIFQLLLGIPLLIGLLKYQKRQNNVGVMLICAGTFIFGMGLISRFFQDNYVGFLTVIIILGIFLKLPDKGIAVLLRSAD
ncbi:MAG: DUF2029 domain-containing protein [Chloroflexi bacterium]|nr:DUF2029 domain-containing protein [Chloroflexota bacterium]